MNKIFHVTRQGQNYGPYTSEQVSELLATGRLQWSDMAWIEGTEGWKPLNMLVSRAEVGSLKPKASEKGKGWRSLAFGVAMIYSLILLASELNNLGKLAPVIELGIQFMRKTFPEKEMTSPQVLEALRELRQPLVVMRALVGAAVLGLVAALFLKKGHPMGVIITAMAALTGLFLALWATYHPKLTPECWICFGVYILVAAMAFMGLKSPQTS